MDSLPQREVAETRQPLAVGAGEKVHVRRIRFSGATELASEPGLQKIADDAIDKHLDFAGLQQLTERITSDLKKQGWLLARAYLPTQDVTAGEVEITLIAGRLSEREPVRITPGGKMALRIDPARLAAIANRQLLAGSAAREGDLNRAVLLMNDLPGVVGRARLEPGDQDGDTRVVLTIDEGPLLSASVMADNFGSRDTGTDQINAGLRLNDPLGIGDQFTVDATSNAGTRLGRLGYSLPLWGELGSDGWKLNLGYTNMSYEVRTPTGVAAGLGGESQTYAASVMYPWLRSRKANVYLSLGQTHKTLLDRSNAGLLRDKRVKASSVSLSGDQLDNLGDGGLTTWYAGFVVGNLALDLPADASADAAGYRTAGDYQKFTYNLARLQKLPGAFTFFTSLSGQEANKNLDSSEKLYLGGPSGVRAYSGSEAGGDSGQMVNIEVRYDWPGATLLGALQLQAFYDAGWVELHHDARAIAIPTASGQNRYGIAGAGLGLSLMRSGSHVIRASWAQKIGSNPGRTPAGLDADGQELDSRFWLQAMYIF